MSDASSRAPRLEFSLEGLPWLDRLAPEVRAYVDRLSPAPEDPDLLYGRLMHWAQFGYVVLPGAIETELIDGLLEDVKELFEEHTKHRVLIDSDVIKGRPICEVPEERMVLQRQGRGDIHMRVLDFVHYSIAAKKISLHSSIAGFLQHVMRARLVVLQSLNFFQGSEQLIHQDYAFVPAKIPSQLAATWVALEDIHPDSGPLEYIPGSHVIPKYDWGDGIFRTPESTGTDQGFADHIRRESEKMGLQPAFFCPKKGDVFVWHGALAHGGMMVKDRSRLRLSYVTHYSNADVHRYHFHRRDVEAEFIEYPGGYFMKNPIDPKGEDSFRRGALIG